MSNLTIILRILFSNLTSTEGKNAKPLQFLNTEQYPASCNCYLLTITLPVFGNDVTIRSDISYIDVLT